MTRSDTGPATARTTLAERAVVLGGLAVAALWTAVSVIAVFDLETVAAAWLAAGVWAFVSSLALAIWRGLRHRDWRAFGRYEMTDNEELVDWSTRTGQYAWMAVAEEHERLMRGD